MIQSKAPSNKPKTQNSKINDKNPAQTFPQLAPQNKKVVSNDLNKAQASAQQPLITTPVLPQESANTPSQQIQEVPQQNYAQILKNAVNNKNKSSSNKPPLQAATPKPSANIQQNQAPQQQQLNYAQKLKNATNNSTSNKASLQPNAPMLNVQPQHVQGNSAPSLAPKQKQHNRPKNQQNNQQVPLPQQNNVNNKQQQENAKNQNKSPPLQKQQQAQEKKKKEKKPKVQKIIAQEAKTPPQPVTSKQEQVPAKQNDKKKIEQKPSVSNNQSSALQNKKSDQALVKKSDKNEEKKLKAEKKQEIQKEKPKNKQNKKQTASNSKQIAISQVQQQKQQQQHKNAAPVVKKSSLVYFKQGSGLENLNETSLRIKYNFIKLEKKRKNALEANPMLQNTTIITDNLNAEEDALFKEYFTQSWKELFTTLVPSPAKDQHFEKSQQKVIELFTKIAAQLAIPVASQQHRGKTASVHAPNVYELKKGFSFSKCYIGGSRYCGTHFDKSDIDLKFVVPELANEDELYDFTDLMKQTIAKDGRFKNIQFHDFIISQFSFTFEKHKFDVQFVLQSNEAECIELRTYDDKLKSLPLEYKQLIRILKHCIRKGNKLYRIIPKLWLIPNCLLSDMVYSEYLKFNFDLFAIFKKAYWNMCNQFFKVECEKQRMKKTRTLALHFCMAMKWVEPVPNFKIEAKERRVRVKKQEKKKAKEEKKQQEEQAATPAVAAAVAAKMEESLVAASTAPLEMEGEDGTKNNTMEPQCEK